MLLGRGINEGGDGFSPTGPGNPENGGYQPAQPQGNSVFFSYLHYKKTCFCKLSVIEAHRPSISPQVPRFSSKQEGNTRKPNRVNDYLPPQNQQRSSNGFSQTTPQSSLPGTGNLPLNNDYNQNQPSLNAYQNENSFNPSTTKNGYQDTTSTRTNNQKPSGNTNVRRINSTSKPGGEGYNYGNPQQQSVNEEQPYQSNQFDRNNESQTTNLQTNNYQGSQKSRGYLPPENQ